MKATTLLEREHRNVQELCDAVAWGSAGMRASLLPQLAGDVAALIAVEERIFYPAACEALHEDRWLQVSRSRHARARSSLDRALGVPIDGEELARAIGDLREAVELRADEETVLFPRLEGALAPGALRDLGVSMLSLYDQQVEAGYRTEPPRGSAASAGSAAS